MHRNQKWPQTPPFVCSFIILCVFSIISKQFRKKCCLTFMGPCNANLFSSITNKMQRYTIIYFCEMLYIFQAVTPPIIRSPKLYIQHRVICQTFTVTCRLSWKRWNSVPSLPRQWLLMLGGGTAWNMQSFTEINNCVTLHVVGYTWK